MLCMVLAVLWSCYTGFPDRNFVSIWALEQNEYVEYFAHAVRVSEYGTTTLINVSYTICNQTIEKCNVG